MQSIRTEEQFEQLVDSVQTEIIGINNPRSQRSNSQKMRNLVDYAESEKATKEKKESVKNEKE